MNPETLLLTALAVGGAYILATTDVLTKLTGGASRPAIPGSLPTNFTGEVLHRADLSPEMRVAMDKAAMARTGGRMPADYTLTAEWGTYYPYRASDGKLHDVGIDPRSGEAAYVTWSPIT